MATETTRVNSYFRSEGYYDSAGTNFSATFAHANSAIADVSGLTGSATAAYFNQVFSGLAASVVASQINNIFSGLASTVTAGMITGNVLRAATADAATTALAAASASYAASAGALSGVSATAGTLNKVQYAATAHKIAYGSAVVTAGSATVSMAEAGITTLAYFYAFPQGSCVSYVTLTASTGSNATIIAVSGGAAITAGIGVNWMAVNA